MERRRKEGRKECIKGDEETKDRRRGRGGRRGTHDEKEKSPLPYLQKAHMAFDDGDEFAFL